MSVELTHEQAFFLRAALELRVDPEIDLAGETLEVYRQLIRDELLAYADVNPEDPYADKWNGRVLLTLEGGEALAKYDREWATVRREDLDIAADSLAAEIREHDDLYAGRPNLLARRDDEREALKRLRAALAAGEAK